MGSYRLKEGSAITGVGESVKYHEKGDVVESERDLAKDFPEKFEPASGGGTQPPPEEGGVGVQGATAPPPDQTKGSGQPPAGTTPAAAHQPPPHAEAHEKEAKGKHSKGW